MIRRKNRQEGDRLDPVEREIVRLAGLDDAGCDQAAASSYLYARIRAGIAAERNRRAGQSDWRTATLLAGRRAAPAMAAIALAVAGIFWFQVTDSNGSAGSSADPRGAASAGVCAISASAQCAVSTDEILSTMLRTNGQEMSR